MTSLVGQGAFSFDTVASIRFGAGIFSSLADTAGPLLGDRVLLVTDQGLMATGFPKAAVDALRLLGVEVSVFDKVEADPAETLVAEAVHVARSFDATGILGLGGGSSLDTAKVVAVAAHQDKPIAALYGVGQVVPGRLPLVLVPTTSGTGSEVTPISILTTSGVEKMGIVSPVLLPDMALLDPELTIGLPAPVTAATGIDAMVHAIEAFTCASANNNPISRTLALEALRLMGSALPIAVASPRDGAARSDMALGSMLAGQAFANSPVAAVHALAYPLGARFKLPHGLTNALMLPHVLRFNCEGAPTLYRPVAQALFPDLGDTSPDQVQTELIDRLQKLSTDLGLPQSLREVDVPRSAIADLAMDAMRQTRLLQNNPRTVTEVDARALYEAAW